MGGVPAALNSLPIAAEALPNTSAQLTGPSAAPSYSSNNTFDLGTQDADERQTNLEPVSVRPVLEASTYSTASGFQQLGGRTDSELLANPFDLQNYVNLAQHQPKPSGLFHVPTFDPRVVDLSGVQLDLLTTSQSICLLMANDTSHPEMFTSTSIDGDFSATFGTGGAFMTRPETLGSSIPSFQIIKEPVSSQGIMGTTWFGDESNVPGVQNSKH